MEDLNFKPKVVLVLSFIIFYTRVFGYTIDQSRQLSFNNNNVAKEKICQRVNIKDWDDFRQLQGCSVIEGSLQINMVFLSADSKYNPSLNMTFPELKEITGFLMSFSTPQILSLKSLFPNLAVIRGQELVENYALLIYKMQAMQDVGLPALTNIMRGGVWIVDNENLCYVDTIDWSKIANESTPDGMFKNKRQCPNTCPRCPKSEIYNERHLCWSKDNCQIIPQITCPHCNGRPCFGDPKSPQCCNSECLGGCYGSQSSQCHVCKRVVVQGNNGPICTDQCPAGFLEYLQRRCVTTEECLKITAIAPVSHPRNPGGNFTGKLYIPKNGRPVCVLECPKDTEFAQNGNSSSCIPCDGTCKKNCPGRIIDSIEAARELSGCTRIVGALKIHIRRSSSASGTIVKELKEHLDKIEEIDHYLAVTYTYSIYSLDFLANLKVIRGNVLDDKKYALVVKSNENLMELWNGTDSKLKNVKIENKSARVLFHYNPKLCVSKIWEFVNQAGIPPPDPKDNIDIGITNGDKAPCNTKTLKVEILERSNSTVVIHWENFRRNLTLTSHLLNYEIHYKEASKFPGKNESKFDDRDPCGDDGWNIQEQAKISDNEVVGIGIHNEPPWENQALIAYLKPYTYYALYVKAIVIQDAYALNNNTGAESDIIYFRTYADYPQKPKNFRLASSGHDRVTATWEPPSISNGVLHSFKIWIKSVPESQTQQDQRSYCEEGRAPLITASSKGTDSFIATTFAPMLSPNGKDPNCCTCNAPTTPKPKDIVGQVQTESDMLDIIMGIYVFTASGASPVSASTSRPEDDPALNTISRSPSRSRRWAREDNELPMTSDEVTDHFPDIFPEGSHKHIDESELAKLPVIKELTFLKEIPYNASIPKYSFVLVNLTHYTTYYIGIQACREVDPDIAQSKNSTDNDTRTCSGRIDESVQTAPSPEADNVDPRTIAYNITEGSKVHLRWNEPPHPNGVVLAYKIFYQKVGASKEDYEEKKCITHEEFQKNGRNYSLGKLPAGNYSFKIQVVSLAQDSDFTAIQYFYIEDINESNWVFWLLVIGGPILVFLLSTGGLSFWFFKKLYAPGHLVISANPEYMQNVEIAEEWEVPRDKVRLLKRLGQGSFGAVFEGELMDFLEGIPKLLCAVKTVSEDTPSEERALFLKEAALMTKLSCVHVVKLLGIVSKTQPIYVVMELMANGDLKQYLRTRRPDSEKKDAEPPPTLKQILRIAAEVADGMAYIHSQRLVHRDLAARNCLVHEDLTVKVGDFGMTKEITDYYRKQTRGLLPVRWMAPESIRDGVFTSPSDVWSFGVVLWEMATLAAQPYQGLSNSQVLEYVQSGRVMEPPDKCPPILYELMAECWKYNHNHRPSFVEILDRLTPHLEPPFAQKSFYHSPEGIEYRTHPLQRPLEDEPITICTPLIATFDASDDELDDYDSDDDHVALGHHIVDDLGDFSTKRLLNNSSNFASIKPSIDPGTSPPRKSSLVENGVALTPFSISANTPYLNSDQDQATVYTTVSPNLPASLFSNPPLRSSISSSATPSSSVNSNNNYTEALFTAPTSNFTIPLTPIKSGEMKSRNKSAPEKPVGNRSPVMYTSVAPVSQTLTTSLQPKNNSGSGIDSNESSKSFSLNCSGESNKHGNGNNTGGNGYILPPVAGNQRNNKTTQF